MLKLSNWLAVGLGLLALSFVSCTDRENFAQESTSEVFLQDFNPETLDILWVVDNRSPMWIAREHIVSEAKKFFTRLDSVPKDYRMAIATASLDMAAHAGHILPYGAPTVITKNAGDLAQRLALFENAFPFRVNLTTSAEDKGIAAGLAVLVGSEFKPRESVPLVLVFISDSDDHSEVPAGQSAEDFYAQKYLALKGGNANLIRAFSVNLLPNGARCTSHNVDIGDRYFNLAAKLSKDATSGVTGDLCDSFADQIDLSGLKLKELSNRFKLSSVPNVNTLRASVTRKSEVVPLGWHFEAATNEVVFDSVPPEGTTVIVTYTVQ